MHISHRPIPNKRGFRATFRHPLQKNLVCLSLQTHEENEAECVCRDAAFIFNDTELVKDERSLRLLAFHPRSVALVFGEQAAARLFSKQEHPPLVDEDDIGSLVARIVAVVDRVPISKQRTSANMQRAEWDTKRAAAKAE